MFWEKTHVPEIIAYSFINFGSFDQASLKSNPWQNTQIWEQTSYRSGEGLGEGETRGRVLGGIIYRV